MAVVPFPPADELVVGGGVVEAGGLGGGLAVVSTIAELGGGFRISDVVEADTAPEFVEGAVGKIPNAPSLIPQK
jgi:hypothetical protein